jgi:23S rRNA G2445 N2-methylase RlmL
MMQRFRYEFTVTPGLESVAERELAATPWGSRASLQVSVGALTAESSVSYPHDQMLRTAIALYEVLDFEVPRPKALLSHQHLSQIIRAAQAVVERGGYKTVSISAAGKSTEVMQRLLAELSGALGLESARDVGDLHVRIRRSSLYTDGWAVLLRQTPRPWATRAWRIENLPGALHAPVAAAMAVLAQIPDHARVLNAGAGSGTIAIETRMMFPSVEVVALDIEWRHICLTKQHAQAAHLEGGCFLQADAERLPFASATFAVVLSDLPFGQWMGRQRDLRAIYTRWLRETARVTQLEGRGIFLTHAVRLMMEVLADVQDVWQVEKIMPITLNGLHPRLFLLRRRSTR